MVEVEAGAEDIECCYLANNLAYYIADHGLITSKNAVVVKAVCLRERRGVAS